MPPKIRLADTAGFCMGVSLALEKLDQAIADRSPDQRIVTFGPIIHNPQVLERYARLGVIQAESPKEVRAGDRVVVRAHGIPLPVEEELKARGAHIVDATCPKVKKAQLLIRKQARLNKTLLLFGEKEHPEIRGLRSYGGDSSVVFESLAELGRVCLDKGPYFLAAQTTQDREEFEKIRKHLQATVDPDMAVLGTICDATKNRQEEVLRIAREVDCMVVVGGYTSGNTRRLAKVAEDEGRKAVHVETAAELPLQELAGCRAIGLTAGASTPRVMIEEVYRTLLQLQAGTLPRL
jgi:4-hydroxy-3-methylbut-2-enyl diphosphate reductase